MIDQTEAWDRYFENLRKKVGPKMIYDPKPCTMEDIVSPALNEQVGGNHYRTLPIQPVEYIHANGLGFFEGVVLKYISRWNRDGGKGLEDLEKAQHYLELLIELEQKQNRSNFE